MAHRVMDKTGLRALLLGALLLSGAAHAQLYTRFGPANGLLVGQTTTPQTTAAAWANIQALLTGTCNSSTYVTGAGTCVTPTFSGFANPSATVGLTTVNGSATTAMRSDAAPALDQSISPTWTGNHIFQAASGISIVSIAPASGVAERFEATASNASGVIQIYDTTNSVVRGYIGSGAVCSGMSNSDLCIAGGNSGALDIGTGGGGGIGAQFGSTGGLILGSPTGGNKGPGTVNATGLFVNGVAVATGGSPGGSTTDMQYNNGGVFGGASNFTYNSSTGGVSIAAPTSGVGFSVTGVASSYVANFQGSGGTGNNFGIVVEAGTNASDVAVHIENSAGSADYFRVYGDGGIVVGAPTGGDEGIGTLNATGIYLNGVLKPSIFGARITNGGSCSVFSQKPAGWITSCTHNATGNTTLTVTGLSATPACSVSVDSGSFAVNAQLGGSNSSTSVQVLTYSTTTPTLTDYNYDIVCIGQ